MNSFTLKLCNDVMSKIREHPISEMFIEPVDPERDGAPDYLKTIKKPMDLGTVQKKLDQKQYKNIQEWKDDMNLITTNATQYNGKKSPVGVVAVELQKLFREYARGISDGSSLTWYNQLLDIKRDIKAHVMQRILREQGESDLTFANPKFQTKDIDTPPEVHRFLIKSMTLEELDALKDAIYREKNVEIREKITNIINKYYPATASKDKINLNLLPTEALIEIKRLCNL